MIFPDARIDGIHHVEAANVAETLAKVILHEVDQPIGIFLRNHGLVPCLLCSSLGGLSSRQRILRSLLRSPGFNFLRIEGHREQAHG